MYELGLGFRVNGISLGVWGLGFGNLGAGFHVRARA